jgi:centromeric protein E
MEIYNENVKDLLRPDSDRLRLLDDPEVWFSTDLVYTMPRQNFDAIVIQMIMFSVGQKGTIVEKLQEEIAKDSQHLRHLISICEGE